MNQPSGDDSNAKRIAAGLASAINGAVSGLFGVAEDNVVMWTSISRTGPIKREYPTPLTSSEPRRFTVVFRQEGDEFGEPVHVHFEDECPVCLTPDAGTSVYGGLWEESPGDKFSCSECDQEFVFVSINIPGAPGEDWGTCEIETVEATV
jgi:hypothetical protein